jgi:hypothetical protein
MAVPTTQVFIGFDLSQSGGNYYFTLDDAIQGKLNSDYVLGGGDVLVDVTQYVQSVSINRGKSRELDRFTAGSASVVLHNDSRIFDPFYADGPYFGQILPRKQVIIKSNGVTQFTGFIDDWDLSYELGNKSYASISCVDAFLQLSAAQLNSFTNVSQKSGLRIAAILNRPEVEWSAFSRNLDIGKQSLQADTVALNTNVLQYLQDVETTESGALFIDKSGAVTFKDRSSNIPPTVDTLIFADDGRANSVPYTEIQVVYGSELLHNRIILTRDTGSPQTAQNTASQGLYGIQTLSIDGLLTDNDNDVLLLATYLSNVYSQPELRFSNLTVTLHDKSVSDQLKLLDVEINDALRIVFTPNNIGDEIDQYALVTGIEHNIGIDAHYVTFQFGYAQVPIILDHPVFGRLGGSFPFYDDSATTYDDAGVKYDGTVEFGYVLAF